MASATRRGSTHFMRIAVTSIDKQEAADIAYELAIGYLDLKQEFDTMRADTAAQYAQAISKGQQQAVERAFEKMMETAYAAGLANPKLGAPPDASDENRGELTKYTMAKANYQQQLQELSDLFPDSIKKQFLAGLPDPPAIMSGVTTESATFSRQHIYTWLAGCVASGLALGSGLWLRRRAA